MISLVWQLLPGCGGGPEGGCGSSVFRVAGSVRQRTKSSTWCDTEQVSRPFARAVTAVLAVFAAGLVGCSGPSGPTASATSLDAVGDSADSASPPGTAPPLPTNRVSTPDTWAAPTDGGRSGQALDSGVAALAACLNGNWTAPVSREFAALGVSERTKGAVRDGTGTLRITFARDGSFTFTYDQVQLSLATGQAVVNGPVTGTWSLKGDTLKTVLVSSQTKVDVKLGPITVGAPGVVTSAVENLPPSDVLVNCSADKLIMQLSTVDGGGIARFDRV